MGWHTRLVPQVRRGLLDVREWEFFGQQVVPPEDANSEPASPRSEPCEWLPGQRAQSAILVWHTTAALRRRPWDGVLKVA